MDQDFFLKNNLHKSFRVNFLSFFLIPSYFHHTMTSVTFHGGVNDIGGNKFLVKDKDTTLFMDFGMSFSVISIIP